MKRVHGNLLEAKADALINTVNTVGVMGQGIALQFKRAFPSNYREYEAACKAGRLVIGKMFIHHLGTMHPHYIINFPTKEHWRGRSKLEYITAGLIDLVEQVKQLEIKSIAVPPLGCGNGGLDWAIVSRLIEDEFSTLPEVAVYAYEPTGAPAPASMPNRTNRPNWTLARAALITLMQRYINQGLDFCEITLLEVQKLAYFLQETGYPLKLDYKAWHYGPYADQLRHVLDHIESHFIEGYGDGQNRPQTPIRVMKEAAVEAEKLVLQNPELDERLRRVERLIDGYSTPFGMEILSTVHWTAKRETHGDNSTAAILDVIQHWNNRKAAKMTPVLVDRARNHLLAQAWIRKIASEDG